jgi:hypothetical protein
LTRSRPTSTAKCRGRRPWNPPALAPTSPLTLLSYAVPVNYDHVTLEFSQLIKKHDPLHTGEYSKTITLTLEQTAL